MWNGWELMGSSHTQMLLAPWGIIASKFSSHPRALVASPPSGTGLDGSSGVWSLYRFHKMQNAAPFVKCACKHFLLKVIMTMVDIMKWPHRKILMYMAILSGSKWLCEPMWGAGTKAFCCHMCFHASSAIRSWSLIFQMDSLFNKSRIKCMLECNAVQRWGGVINSSLLSDLLTNVSSVFVRQASVVNSCNL